MNATSHVGAGGSHETVPDLLRRNGLRVTAARVAILEELGRTRAHLSAAALHRRISARLRSIHLVTAYRATTELQQAGILHLLSVPGEATYGLAGEPHGHVVCSRCGAVVDVRATSSRRARHELAAATGFALDPYGLTATGMCPACSIHAERTI